MTLSSNKLLNLTSLSIVALACASLFINGCKSSEKTLPINASDLTLQQQVVSEQKLSAGVKFETPPFGYMDNSGELKGYDIDLIKEIGKRLSSKDKPIIVDFHQVLPSTRIIGLNLGKLDLVAATMTITPQRKKLIDFSDQYFTAGQAVMVKRDSKYKRLADLDRSKVLYVMGTTSEGRIRKALPNAKFRGFKTTTGAFEALERGDAEALTNDDIILYALMKDSCEYRLLPERLSQEPYGLGIRKSSRQQNTVTFRKTLNKVLNEIKADGTLKKLETKWITPLKDKTHCQS